MPWVPDDDPVLKELRAWRDELGGAPVDAEAAGPVDAPTPADAEPTEATARDVPTQIAHAVGRSAPGVRRRVRQVSQATASPASHSRPRAPRHASWDVMTTASPEPLRSPEDVENAAAETITFPSLSPTHVSEGQAAEPAIVVSHLRKTFGDFTAVDDVSFAVPKGTIVALLGPNGAGKTTTVNMLCTLLAPDGGEAVVAGHDIVDDASAVRGDIMLTGQFAALDEALTGRENLILFGRLLGLPKKRAAVRADELLAEFGLTEAAGRRVGKYSGGMRRRIDIACGLVTRPEVVFLDEPTTGLDPRSRQEVWAVVEQLRDSGVTILLTTQYLEEADRLSDNIVVIDGGRVIAEGTSDELKAATGAAYCEVTPAHPAYLPRLRARLADMLDPQAARDRAPDGAASDDAAQNESEAVSVPAPDGPQTLAEVIRRTEAAKIPLADIVLRRPSLDEVFLALTDKTTGSARPGDEDDAE
ncbi:ATP-binding cassette domain-containing protein [Gordonia sp. MP11Mi]